MHSWMVLVWQMTELVAPAVVSKANSLVWLLFNPTRWQMDATPEMLIGMMILLLVLALFLVVFLIRAMRRNSGKQASGAKPKDEKSRPGKVFASETQRVQPVPEPDVPVTAEAATPPTVLERTPSDADTELVMRVWQDREGRLVVEAQGQRYRHLFEIRDGEVGRRVLDIINRLSEFAQLQESRLSPESPPWTDGSALPAAAGHAESDDVIDKLRAQDDAQPPRSRITADPLPFRPQNPGQQSNITLDLAREVDQLLQVRLKATPEFAQRYIHVIGARDGTLRFDVDGRHYGSLQEVPDLQVRQVIQAAIADWETRR
jgi:hypothetical protein